MKPLLISLITFFSTLLGGLFALKFKDKLHFIMAFAAGVLLGVVFFDIFPEIIEQTNISHISPTAVMISLVCGFLLIHILEKTILIHHAHETDYVEHQHPKVGVLSAVALIGHSFMDGVSIGVGFQISATVGLFMSLAVIFHDFTDGMNTATLMLFHKNTQKKSLIFLLLDSAAPILGVLATLFFVFPANFLILYLGFFAGFLLYIGASDILPEAHSQHSSMKLIGLTVLGTLFIFIVTRFV